MMRLSFLPLLFLTGVLLTSCFKKDDYVVPHTIGNLVTDTISMTQNYRYQVYFDLFSGSSIKQNPRTNSDLGFECSSRGWKILPNTANYAKVADLGIVPFGQKQDTVSRKWLFDKSDGNPDSLSIGQWFAIVNNDTVSNGHVYAIDRGIDENGKKLGLCQAIFDSLKGGRYYFRFAGINGDQGYSAIIRKDTTINYKWFSFDQGGTLVENEPPKTSYDLLFSQYTTMLYTDKGEPYPYLVTGVLTNRYSTSVGLDSIHPFTDITLMEAKQAGLSTALDRIGYDWKFYSFETGGYTMRSGLSYIVLTSKGIYYKLRFIGFYNTKGEKGYPVIEYQAL
ncbi:MAG: HmuY family protein [Bacteroidota bacterium]